MDKLKKNKAAILVTILTAFAGFLHFYNLNWGAPWYFHPDERNIASSISQLQFPNQMNPHFFAYGSLPIYTIYFTGVLVNLTSKLPTFNSQLLAPRSSSSLSPFGFAQGVSQTERLRIHSSESNDLGEMGSVFSVSFSQ